MDVHHRLENVFRQVFDNDELELHDNMTSADIPNWDSVNHINLIFAVEQEFDTQFSERELERLATVGVLKEMLASKVPS